MKPRVGQTLTSPVDSTTVIVVRAPDSDISLTCAGVEMVDPKAKTDQPNGTADPNQMGGTVIGKRYADEALGLELLCTKPGKGTLAVNGEPVPMKQSKPLPASD